MTKLPSNTVVERLHRNRKLIGSNPVEALIFFQALIATPSVSHNYDDLLLFNSPENVT